MLVLTRKVSQRIVIGKDITITVVRVDGNKVRIGIDAPSDVAIFREEVLAHDAEKSSLEAELSVC